jgi:hypothetical protein
MSLLPDWNSIESTSRWSDILFWAGIICLVLLAATEVASHIYGSRSSFLSGEAARHAEDQRKQDEDSAETRRKTEVERLQKQLTDADKKVVELQAGQADRHLSAEQRQTILAAIAPHPGQIVDLVAVATNGEAYRYAQEFAAIFQAAGWQIVNGGISQAIYTGDVVGITVTISAANGAAHQAPIGAARLIQTMVGLGLITEGFSGPEVQGDNVQVRIGRKPPAP